VKGEMGLTLTKKGNLSGTQMGPGPIEGTGAGVYGWGLRRAQLQSWAVHHGIPG